VVLVMRSLRCVCVSVCVCVCDLRQRKTIESLCYREALFFEILYRHVMGQIPRQHSVARVKTFVGQTSTKKIKLDAWQSSA